MPDATYPDTPSLTTSWLATEAYLGKRIEVVATADVSCMQLHYACGFVGVNLGRGAGSTCPDASGSTIKMAIEDVWSYPAGDFTFSCGDRLFYDRANQALSNDSTDWWFAVVVDASIISTFGRFKFKFNINQGSQPSYHTP